MVKWSFRHRVISKTKLSDLKPLVPDIICDVHMFVFVSLWFAEEHLLCVDFWVCVVSAGGVEVKKEAGKKGIVLCALSLVIIEILTITINMLIFSLYDWLLFVLLLTKPVNTSLSNLDIILLCCL